MDDYWLVDVQDGAVRQRMRGRCNASAEQQVVALELCLALNQGGGVRSGSSRTGTAALSGNPVLVATP